MSQQYILIEMSESLTDISPANPATRKGAVISIGFDKNTKLSLVLEHFVDFLNRHPLDPPKPTDVAKDATLANIAPAEWRIRNQVSTGQLEFYHAEILRLNESFEGAAVMKADKIRCRRKRSRKREDEFQHTRKQREIDREYFRRMARLLTQSNGGNGVAPCDVVFYCTGKLVEDGRRQEVLTPIVRAHSVMCCRRSQYLRRLIDGAKEEREQEELRVQREREVQARGLLQQEEGAGAAAGAAHAAPAAGGGDLHIPVPLGGEDETSRLGVVASSPRRPAPAGGNMDEDDDDDDDAGIVPVAVAHPAAADNHANQAAGVGVVGVAANADEIEHRRDHDDFASHEGNALIPADSVDAAELQRSPTSTGQNRNSSASSSVMGRNAVGDMGGQGSDEPFLAPAAASSSRRSEDPAKLWIPLNHPPEAVRLLLEYVYTNRVVCLGREAFDTGSLDPPPGTPNHLTLMRPMVPPYGRKEWPDGVDGKRGHPTILLSVALAGIQLAEEAQLPRLSLMCEVAASQLVSRRSVLDALALCNAQQQRTGNKLPILRKAAMLDHIFAGKSRGVGSLFKMPIFRKGLEDHPEDIVPSLLTGTLEAIKSQLGEKQRPDEVEKYHKTYHKHHHGHHHHHIRRSHKRVNAEAERFNFKQFDEYDNAEREAERRKRRKERHPNPLPGFDGAGAAGDSGMGDGSGAGPLGFARQLDIAFIREDTLGARNFSGAAVPGQHRSGHQSGRNRGGGAGGETSSSRRKRRAKHGAGH